MKEYLEAVMNFAMYGGLTSEQYHDIVPQKRNENKKRLKTFSLIGVIGFGAVAVLNLVTNGFAASNQIFYGITAAAMAVIYLLVSYVVPKHEKLVMPLTYFFIAILNFFAISVALLHPELPAVSIFVFLLAVPLLFVDKPIRMMDIIIFIGVAFCIITRHEKAPEIAEVDVWNMVTFGFVTIVVNLFLMKFKIKALYESKMVVYLSETDVLTGLKNRNQFEKMLQNYQHAFENNLICIYADVNGLHELNNTKGHEEGDKMLVFVARSLMDKFGSLDAFRVGGDEFIIFQCDRDKDATHSHIDELNEKFKENNYHVSFGVVEATEKGSVEMESLVKDAEKEMYDAKRRYYEESGLTHDRRRNREGVNKL